tara:strand:+ start:736 stop:1467 length:732 start_codon:yes stop_codon:yes gene_type:complete
MTVVGIVPCRYNSSRFPGKPLANIHGKPMMWHVFQRARESECFDNVYIATDDLRIKQTCDELGLEVLMTRDDHFTGTDRVAECMGLVDADVYVNIQGDEPMIELEAITTVTQALLECDDPRVMASNAYVPFVATADVIDTNNVKVVLSANDHALFYSRQPIPYPKSSTPKYYRQLGLYAFRKSGLQVFAEHAPGPAEQAEGVEMIRFLEFGYKVLMVEVEDNSIPVDTEADLARVVEMMSAES